MDTFTALHYGNRTVKYMTRITLHDVTNTWYEGYIQWPVETVDYR